MLDRLRLMIPFSPPYVTGGRAFLSAADGMSRGHKGLLFDIEKMGIPLAAKSVSYVTSSSDTLYRDWEVTDLYHPFESLPSSFTALAFKVYHMGNHWPYIELKASPAKLLQGHNVFGGVSIADGAAEMITTLQQAYPKLFDCLEIESAQVWELDCTYSARLRSDTELRQVINALRNVSNGQTKPSKGEAYATTVYWGSRASRLKRLKAYAKFEEFMTQLSDYKKDADKGDLSAKAVYEVMSDPRLQDWAKNLLRFESTICARWLERRGISVMLKDLIKLQHEFEVDGLCLIAHLWTQTTLDIFKAFEGQTMRLTDDESVLSALKAVHYKVTPKGNISYSKANKLFLFYSALREKGYAELMKIHDSNKTFYRHINDLLLAGFTKAQLQSLHGNEQTNIVPLLRFVEVDFGSQRPDWYVEPRSRFLAQQAA